MGEFDPTLRSKLRLVIVHYHLNRGGVTSVIRSHLQSLAQVSDSLKIDQVCLAYGGREANWNRDFARILPFPVSHRIIPELEYCELRVGDGNLLEQLRRLLADTKCVPEETVVHVHNHALGKNAKLPSALIQLTNVGWRLLLQVHDFAEDLRPANYSHLLSAYSDEIQLWQTLYPQAPQIHYATLNQADHARLNEAGVEGARLYVLPNPVASDYPNASFDTGLTKIAARRKLQEAYSVALDAPYVLYPVRGIRRKNLGEVLLWSMLLEGTVFSVTLEPKNSRERRSFNAWRHFSDSLALPIIFGSGKRLSLDENYAAADAIVSTSVAEGFGLVFLEAAIHGRPLFGRNLPGVTSDFIGAGMRFPGLADTLLVPVSAFDVDELRAAYQRWSDQLRVDYGLTRLDQSELRITLDALLQDQVFDFARLNLEQQQVVISRAHEHEELRSRICSLNPCVDLVKRALAGDHSDLSAAVVENRAVIQEHYSLESIGTKLASAYRTLLNCAPEPVESNSNIGRYLLDTFAAPEHLFPIRVEP